MDRDRFLLGVVPGTVFRCKILGSCIRSLNTYLFGLPTAWQFHKVSSRCRVIIGTLPHGGYEDSAGNDLSGLNSHRGNSNPEDPSRGAFHD